MRGQSFSAGQRHMLVLSRALRTDPSLDGLTPAQRDVLAALVRGASNAEIAALRKTSPRTIANQIAALFRVLAVRSRYDLAARFAQVMIEGQTK